MSLKDSLDLSLVIPCYNEEAVLPLLETRLRQFPGNLGCL
jgi:glycosyltransferase involved in cell wall biosynthesis